MSRCPNTDDGFHRMSFSGRCRECGYVFPMPPTVADMRAQRDAYREAGARLAKEIHQSMYIPNLTLEMCREMVDKEAEKILSKRS